MLVEMHPVHVRETRLDGVETLAVGLRMELPLRGVGGVRLLLEVWPNGIEIIGTVVADNESEEHFFPVLPSSTPGDLIIFTGHGLPAYQSQVRG